MPPVQKPSRPIVTNLATGSVTIATFAKFFTPFYLIGSTAIFAATSLLGLGLFATNWRPIFSAAATVRNLLAVIILFYVVITISFFAYSLHQVPLTYLIGILIFHLLFLLFGFAAAQALDAVFAVLLAQGAIYLVIFTQYIVRFGDFMHDGYLRDVFGIGYRPLYIGVHQEIGAQVALAALAALGFSRGRIRLLSLAILLPVFWFLYHIEARTALVTLSCALLVLLGGALGSRSKKLALVTASTFVLTAIATSVVFYEYAIHKTNLDPSATDPISRTIIEIQHPAPLLRLGIWARAWHRITSEPDRLPFGRGIGVYPIDEGFGAPDWLLRNTGIPKYYPHNVYLELLYETGIFGMAVFTAITLFPLVAAAKYWRRLSLRERTAISIYVFYLVSMAISGSFAYAYDFLFFLAIAIGIIALKRAELILGRADGPLLELAAHSLSA